MLIDIDKETVIKDFAELLATTNIHGHINSRHKHLRKSVVSKIGIECGEKLAECLMAYLEAWKKD